MMVQKAHSLPGVTEHGKVGQDVVAQTASTAGIWAYPTEFPEIFCITAVKAQAAGAIPVCSDYAALDEMVQYGDKMSFDSSKDLDKFADRLIWWLKHPEKQAGIRQKMKAWARTKSWENTARGWLDDFAQ
jgi:glycosyltransferase involved in cell wall biosynthesis